MRRRRKRFFIRTCAVPCPAESMSEKPSRKALKGVKSGLGRIDAKNRRRNASTLCVPFVRSAMDHPGRADKTTQPTRWDAHSARQAYNGPDDRPHQTARHFRWPFRFPSYNNGRGAGFAWEDAAATNRNRADIWRSRRPVGRCRRGCAAYLAAVLAQLLYAKFMTPRAAGLARADSSRYALLPKRRRWARSDGCILWERFAPIGAGRNEGTAANGGGGPARDPSEGGYKARRSRCQT